MKTYLRVAAVTAALQELLQSAVHLVVSNGSIKTGPPFAASSQFQGINIFLFQVERNMTLALQDLPTRDAAGGLMQRPAAALDLHYLLTFYGDESQLIPQQILGAAMSWIHAAPVLSVPELVRIAEADTATGRLVADSGLAEQIERVKLTFLPLPIEELMRLWTVFQVPYALTVTFNASVVLLEAPETPPEPKLVTKVQLLTLTSPIPHPLTVTGSSAEIDVYGDIELTVLDSPANTLKFALRDFAVEPDDTAVHAATFTLTPERAAQAGLRVGTNPLRVLSESGVTLAQVPFTLCPRILGTTRSTTPMPGLPRPGKLRDLTITAKIAPIVASDQLVTMTLASEKRDPRQATSVKVSDAGAIVGTFQNVEPGLYRIVVSVDGHSSVPLAKPRQGLSSDMVLIS